MERAEEERREAKDKDPGPQEGRGWPSTGVPQKSATGQDSRSPPPHPSNTGDEGERFRNGGWDRSLPFMPLSPTGLGMRGDTQLLPSRGRQHFILERLLHQQAPEPTMQSRASALSRLRTHL